MTKPYGSVGVLYLELTAVPPRVRRAFSESGSFPPPPGHLDRDHVSSRRALLPLGGRAGRFDLRGPALESSASRWGWNAVVSRPLSTRGASRPPGAFARSACSPGAGWSWNRRPCISPVGRLPCRSRGLATPRDRGAAVPSLVSGGSPSSRPRLPAARHGLRRGPAPLFCSTALEGLVCPRLDHNAFGRSSRTVPMPLLSAAATRSRRPGSKRTASRRRLPVRRASDGFSESRRNRVRAFAARPEAELSGYIFAARRPRLPLRSRRRGRRGDGYRFAYSERTARRGGSGSSSRRLVPARSGAPPRWRWSGSSALGGALARATRSRLAGRQETSTAFMARHADRRARCGGVLRGRGVRRDGHPRHTTNAIRRSGGPSGSPRGRMRAQGGFGWRGRTRSRPGEAWSSVFGIPSGAIGARLGRSARSDSLAFRAFG